VFKDACQNADGVCGDGWNSAIGTGFAIQAARPVQKDFMMTRFATVLASTLLCAAPALAQDFEDFDRLDARIADAANAMGVKAETIDRRIKLPRCPEAAMLDTGGNTMIAVRCLSLGWRLRVPAVSAPGPISQNKAEPFAIRRGEGVNVMIVGDSFSVSYDATAMDDGAVGKPIRVKFSSGGTFLTATVIAPGKVQMAD
jgi:flagella basal body P-ring formation protein FlgA